MLDLATLHGEGWRAQIIPLSVDGMLVAATLAIVSQRRARRPVTWMPWLGLTLGILASLAANVAAAHPDLIARLIASWPPLALAISIETLVVVLRAEQAAADAPSAHEEAATAEPHDTDGPDPLLEQARKIMETATLLPVGRNRLARELGITPHRARLLLSELANDVGVSA
jgi:hypothetical protein